MPIPREEPQGPDDVLAPRERAAASVGSRVRDGIRRIRDLAVAVAVAVVVVGGGGAHDLHRDFASPPARIPRVEPPALEDVLLPYARAVVQRVRVRGRDLGVAGAQDGQRDAAIALGDLGGVREGARGLGGGGGGGGPGPGYPARVPQWRDVQAGAQAGDEHGGGGAGDEG